MNNHHFIPVAFPNKTQQPNGTLILAADIGGTKTDMALFELKEEGLVIVREKLFSSSKFNSLEEVILAFSEGIALPERLGIAFAGPIQQGKAKATNLKWEIDASSLSRTLGIAQVFLLNDLEAEAYGLAALKSQDILSVYSPLLPASGNVGIIAPGTGLGEAGLYWDGKALHPFATEGGHTDFSPRNATDWEFLLYLQQKFGHVSWERIISGPGIFNIFCFLRDVKKQEVPSSLQELLHTTDPAAAIATGAKEGSPICLETLELFAKYLAIESSNVALKFKATGGIFIGGGIIPKIWNKNLEAIFLDHFFQVGRLRPLLEATPVYVILNHRTALLGAAYYCCF